MQPSQVRRQILDEHAELRRRLREIAELAKQIEAGRAGVGAALGRQSRALYEALAAHIETEEKLLEPALRSTNPEGSENAERLARDHREQRDLLGYLERRLEAGTPPAHVLLREIQNFAAYLGLEMAYEEEKLLTPEALGEEH